MQKHRTAKHHWAFEDSLGYLARMIFQAFSGLCEQHTRQYGISSGQWTFLRQLWREDGISQRQLGRRLAMRDATIAVALRALEQASLVRRRVNPRDRRETLVHLTGHARRLKPLLLPATAEIQASVTRDFSKAEVDMLQHLLFRLIDNWLVRTRTFGTACSPVPSFGIYSRALPSNRFDGLCALPIMAGRMQ